MRKWVIVLLIVLVALATLIALAAVSLIDLLSYKQPMLEPGNESGETSGGTEYLEEGVLLAPNAVLNPQT